MKPALTMPRFMMIRRRALSSIRKFGSAQELKKTPLHSFHKNNGGKMVPFGGWDMPVEYSNLSIMASTQHTRKGASLFDVSHMGQLKVHGNDRVEFMERVVVGSVTALKPNQTRYTMMTNDEAGIIDDCVVTKRDDHLYMVINASRIEPDMLHMNAMLETMKGQGKDVRIETMFDDRSLVALQGPKAAEALQKLTGTDLSALKFFYMCDADIGGISCQISRSGYTGEDGFEIGCAADQVEKLATILVEQENVELAGLGARDALRLEAGLCLYGNDLNEQTTPVEANLMWTISKKRLATAEFPGVEIIRDQAENPFVVKRKRIGLIGADKGPVPRQGMAVVNRGKQVGVVTSGCFSPCLQKPIAMAYVNPTMGCAENNLEVAVRKKMVQMVVTPLPFLKKGYYS